MQVVDGKTGGMRQTAALLIAAKFLSFALTLGLPFLVVRQLNQHDFGVYKQVFLLISTGANLLMLGFPMSAYYFIPRMENRQAVIANIMTYLIGMGLLMSAVAMAWPGWLVWITNDVTNARLAGAVGVASASFMVAYFLETVALVNQEIGLASFVMVAGPLSRTAIIFILAWRIGTVESLLYGMIAHSVLQIGLLFWYLATRFPSFWWAQDAKLFGEQFRYVFSLSLPALVMNMQSDLHQYVVSRRYGPTQFAIYANGCLQVPVTLLTEAVGPLLVRQISEYEKNGDKPSIVRITLEAGRNLALVYFPVCIVLIVLGREFLTFLYTKRYLESYDIFSMNMLLLPMGIILFDPISRAYPQYQKQLFRLRLFLLAGLVAGIFLLMSWFGMKGTMMALVGMTLVDRILVGRFWVDRLESDPKLLWRSAAEYSKILLAAILAAVPTEIVRRALEGNGTFWILAVGGLVYALSYAVSLGLLGGVQRRDLDGIKAMLRR